jgi:hypothetical protein
MFRMIAPPAEEPMARAIMSYSMTALRHYRVNSRISGKCAGDGLWDPAQVAIGCQSSHLTR